MTKEIRQELIEAANRCECAAFIDGDPVQFPHRYTDRRDIEVSAFISAWMAYGSRKVFLGVLDRLHYLMDSAGGPYHYIVSGGWKKTGQGVDCCLYRFYKWADFSMLCARLASIYSRMESLENLFVPGEPLEKGVFDLCSEFEGVNGIPVPGSTSANKRFYMFLRWMVRKNSPVDFGLWTHIVPKQLLVPVDTHVYATAKSLGLTSRCSADLKTSIEITGQMAQIWPDDPARGDFALYGSQVM
ncbi:MAG: TIGR02757 family protein [Bacteroidaceae bacterium]|nr:TIGR02757 family protein [Bacteroidaceae bacterium]